MQKNWYILYTRPKSEKKVTLLLTKRKIENFCPLNCKQVVNARKSKTICEPLFESYVFVYIKENEVPSLTQTEGVVSLVYWKGKPAVIGDEEVRAIKEFSNAYTDIKLEKNGVNIYGDLLRGSDDQPSYRRDGNLLMIKNRLPKVYLPSIGFTMIANIEVEKGRGMEITFGNKELKLQS